MDFVIVHRGAPPTVVECKWSADEFDPSGTRAFRSRYPGGANYVVASDVSRSYSKTYGNIRVDFETIGRIPELAVIAG